MGRMNLGRRKTQAFLFTALSLGSVRADSQLAIETQTANAIAKYGITGKGVIVAILDRGIDYTHPDFRHADGTTRILYLLDMSGQNLCASNNPAPTEYNASQINAALQSGTPLNTRDAVGHGTVTAGIAAGNGSAFGTGPYAGMAPDADLLIVKVTSEGAPAHGNQPAESAFQGCYSQALDWVIAKANLVGEPVVALINSGTQWGPIDGTSALSQKIDQDFGSNQPGRVYVAASGDEGTIPNHAGSDYTASGPIIVNFSKSNTTTTYVQIWYTGSQPANVTVTFADDGAVVGPAGPGGNASSDGIAIFQYNPGQQFYPWTSSGPDRAVWIQIVGHSGAGTLQIQGTQPGSGHADLYSDAAPVVTFTDHLVAGRLNDYSSTSSAIVTACYNLRTSWVDIDGNPQSLTSQGSTGQLWTLSSGGPTRDGRVPPAGGVDLTTPGGNVFAAYGQNSYWETFRFNLVQDGGAWYGRQSATSGASPITVGAAALLLQMNLGLTGGAIKTILHNTSLSDSNTGPTPNSNWGLGKLDVLAAADAIAAVIPANPVVSPSAITFPAQQVGTTSSPISIQLSNTGTAALRVISISTSGDFVLSGQNCGSSVAAGGSCAISIGFRPSGTGNRTGTLTIKDINGSSPQTVMLTGTGSSTGCTYGINSPSATFPSAGGSGSVLVTATNGCLWPAASYAQWLTITSGSSGTGNGAVNYSVSANVSSSSRSGTLIVAGIIFTVTQAAPTTAAAALRDTVGSIRLSTYASSTLSNSGGVFASDPSTAQDLNGNTFVTARDNFNSIWANVYNPNTSSWSGWRFGGGIIQGGPSIAVDTSGTAWIASRDNYNSYWLVSYTSSGSFGSWTPLLGIFSTDPVVAACGDGSIYLIGKDNFNSLWSGRYISGTGFQGWQFGGGIIKGKPAATCGGDNAVYVAAEDNFNSNWMARVAGNSWTGWFYGGAITSVTPRIAALGSGSEAVVILDSTNVVWRTTFSEGTANGWQPWVQVGGVLQDVSAAGVGGQLYFAGKAPNGDLWWWRQSGSQWTWIGNSGVAAGALSAAPH